MANYRFSSDIIDAALFAAGEPTDGTSDYEAIALAYLNRTYQAIWLGAGELDSTIHEDWHWLLSTTPAVLTLNPVVTTGTVDVANNSASILFNTAHSPSMAGRFFKTTNNPDVFRIATHTSGTMGATLDSVYTGTADTAATFKLMQLDYALPANVLRVVAPIRVYRDSQREIEGMALPQLERDWPLYNVQGGTPRAFAMIGDQKVRFSHYGSETANDYIRADFDYLQMPANLTNSSTEEPLVPLQFRKTLADFVTFRLMLDKNDNRADVYGLMGRGGLKAMERENRHKLAIMGREAGHIFTRLADSPANLGPLRTSSGLIIG